MSKKDSKSEGLKTDFWAIQQIIKSNHHDLLDLPEFYRSHEHQAYIPSADTVNLWRLFLDDPSYLNSRLDETAADQLIGYFHKYGSSFSVLSIFLRMGRLENFKDLARAFPPQKLIKLFNLPYFLYESPLQILFETHDFSTIKGFLSELSLETQMAIWKDGIQIPYSDADIQRARAVKGMLIQIYYDTYVSIEKLIEIKKDFDTLRDYSSFILRLNKSKIYSQFQSELKQFEGLYKANIGDKVQSMESEADNFETKPSYQLGPESPLSALDSKGIFDKRYLTESVRKSSDELQKSYLAFRHLILSDGNYLKWPKHSSSVENKVDVFRLILNDKFYLNSSFAFKKWLKFVDKFNIVDRRFQPLVIFLTEGTLEDFISFKKFLSPKEFQACFLNRNRDTWPPFFSLFQNRNGFSTIHGFLSELSLETQVALSIHPGIISKPTGGYTENFTKEQLEMLKSHGEFISLLTPYKHDIDKDCHVETIMNWVKSVKRLKPEDLAFIIRTVKSYQKECKDPNNLNLNKLLNFLCSEKPDVFLGFEIYYDEIHNLINDNSNNLTPEVSAFVGEHILSMVGKSYRDSIPFADKNQPREDVSYTQAQLSCIGGAVNCHFLILQGFKLLIKGMLNFNPSEATNSHLADLFLCYHGIDLDQINRRALDKYLTLERQQSLEQKEKKSVRDSDIKQEIKKETAAFSEHKLQWISGLDHFLDENKEMGTYPQDNVKMLYQAAKKIRNIVLTAPHISLFRILEDFRNQIYKVAGYLHKSNYLYRFKLLDLGLYFSKLMMIVYNEISEDELAKIIDQSSETSVQGLDDDAEESKAQEIEEKRPNPIVLKIQENMEELERRSARLQKLGWSQFRVPNSFINRYNAKGQASLMKIYQLKVQFEMAIELNDLACAEDKRKALLEALNRHKKNYIGLNDPSGIEKTIAMLESPQLVAELEIKATKAPTPEYSVAPTIPMPDPQPEAKETPSFADSPIEIKTMLPKSDPPPEYQPEQTIATIPLELVINPDAISAKTKNEITLPQVDPTPEKQRLPDESKPSALDSKPLQILDQLKKLICDPFWEGKTTHHLGIAEGIQRMRSIIEEKPGEAEDIKQLFGELKSIATTRLGKPLSIFVRRNSHVTNFYKILSSCHQISDLNKDQKFKSLIETTIQKSTSAEVTQVVPFSIYYTRF